MVDKGDEGKGESSKGFFRFAAVKAHLHCSEACAIGLGVKGGTGWLHITFGAIIFHLVHFYSLWPIENSEACFTVILSICLSFGFT